MDNFTRIKIQKLFSLAIIIVSAVLLQACGGQRDEPFNASSSSSQGSSIPVKKILAGDQPDGVTEVEVDPALVTITDAARLKFYWEKYSTTPVSTVPNFDKGQVLLLDLGQKAACDRKSTYTSIKAYQKTSGVVVVQYFMKKIGSSSSSSATATTRVCDDETLSQPFYFFYIESLDLLEVIEEVN